MNNFQKNIFIVEAKRTAIGSTFKALKDFSAAELAGFAIKGTLDHSALKKDTVDQIIFGNTVSAGTGQNIARHAGFLAGLPVSTPGFTINHVCGSGLQALILGAQAIFSNEADIVMAGGTESASQAPYLVKRKDKEKKEENLTDSLIYDGLTCQLTGKHMGNLVENIAQKFHVSRQVQDKFSFESHQKACLAQEAGKFNDEIVGVSLKSGEVFRQDQRPRKNIDLEKLNNLPPAFREGGTVTAGNSSIPSDGAAAFVLASQEAVKKYKLEPKARLLGYSSIALAPEEVFLAAIPSIEACLQKCALKISDVDLFEISEAFAVQAILTQEKLKIPNAQMNIYGGDVALGHPLGAAGARILVTLIHALMNEKKKRGVAAVCLGGGGAITIAIETIK